MAESGIRVHGLREVVRSLEKFGVEVSDLKAAFKKVGTFIVDEAQSRAPMRSGRLAASIRPSNTKNKSVVRAGSARVPYAGVIHYGWPGHNISPQPFLTDALEANQDEAVEIIEDELQRLIRSLGLN